MREESQHPAAGVSAWPGGPEGRALRLSFVASDAPGATEGATLLRSRYGEMAPEAADVIVALGGDGLMLSAIHAFLNTGKPLFGMNRGSVGFLMNEFRLDGLVERIAAAKMETVHPLRMVATMADGGTVVAPAVNEVSFLRQSGQAAKLRLAVDGTVRLEELICDGVIVATAVGSTAYNLSAHGPIIPLNAPLLAVTPISPFRPRRWRGALVPNTMSIRIDVLEGTKRPVNVAADHLEVKSVVRVDISEDRTAAAAILFDRGHSWEERILAEQFRY